MIMSMDRVDMQAIKEAPPIPINPHYALENKSGEVEYEKKYLFKELVERDEFLQMFALRYLVYRYVNFIEPNADQLNIDCYDRYSSLMGAYEITGQSKRLIGTVRVISEDTKSPYLDELDEIIDSLRDHKVSALLNKPKKFPITETFRIPEHYLKSLSNNGKRPGDKDIRAYEISRLAILPEYWGSKAKIESGLHELIILDSWHSYPHKEIYLIATHPRTKRRYQKFGFKSIPGTKERVYKQLKQLAVAMAMNLQDYLETPNPYVDHCKTAFNSYMDKGYFIRS